MKVDGQSKEDEISHPMQEDDEAAGIGEKWLEVKKGIKRKEEAESKGREVGNR